MIKKWTLLTYNHILTIYLSLQRTAITRSFTEKDCFSIPEVWVWVNRVLLYHWESPLVTPVGYQVFFFSLRSFQTGDFNMLNFPQPCIKLLTWHHPSLPAIFHSCPRVLSQGKADDKISAWDSLSFSFEYYFACLSSYFLP